MLIYFWALSEIKLKAIKKILSNIIPLLLSIHLLNMSVNIDDRILNNNGKNINEIESLYELVVVSLLGENYAINDTNESNEDKSSVTNYFFDSQKPAIQSFHKPQIERNNFIANSINVYKVVNEITPPPPRV